MKNLTPKKIVRELDKYIIGQTKAKMAVSIALRNRWRRQMVERPMRDEIIPNNIILIGTTGVGKTEISRRLSALMGSAFVKVEASKFTEIGYVGRDVESMIRDLVEVSVKQVKNEKEKTVAQKALQQVNERILDYLFPVIDKDSAGEVKERQARTREKLRQRLENMEFEDRYIEIKSQSSAMPLMQVVGPLGLDEMTGNIQDMISNILPKKNKTRKMKVSSAREVLLEEEAEKLIDFDEVVRIAIQRAENNGIVFIDEIDKVAGKNGGQGPDVSREGVQRDILPIVEGCTVSTKYGQIRTDHILFIAAGAFHVSKPSDLIPELQGRFPIRVEMENLTWDDFIKILTKPKNALIKQYQALFKAENVDLVFERSAIREIARIAWEVNEKMENIGARRLHTVLTTLLDDYLFRLPDKSISEVKIDIKFVTEKLGEIIEDEDLSRYIL
ncbi:MAG: ATP-dependent protease ATPase subunit HslU [FCB group bacterium]|nr:ATP-dependent protease ATPase subunit HslU [FCB group bacterium]